MDIQKKNNKGYDLITVGQALHYFDIQNSLQKIKECLSDDGKFVVYGYTAQSIFNPELKAGEPQKEN